MLRFENTLVSGKECKLSKESSTEWLAWTHPFLLLDQQLKNNLVVCIFFPGYSYIVGRGEPFQERIEPWDKEMRPSTELPMNMGQAHVQRVTM